MVSIIAINYNSTGMTLAMLRSIETLRRNDLEVIIVDNASKQNPEQEILNQFPWVKFFRSDVNLGFAGGNNMGLKYATGDFIFYINNDTYFNSDIIGKLVTRFNEDETLGVVCPVLYDYEVANNIQYAGFTSLNFVTGRNKMLKEFTGVDSNGLIQTPYAHGAAMMVRKSVIDAVGEMPENYFLYYEEMDWCESIRKAGFTIAVDTCTAFFHMDSYTIGKTSELKSYFMTRNRILFMRRNSPMPKLAAFWLFFVLIATPKCIIQFARTRQWKNIAAHFAGIFWNLQKPIFSRELGYKYNSLGQI